MIDPEVDLKISPEGKLISLMARSPMLPASTPEIYGSGQSQVRTTLGESSEHRTWGVLWRLPQEGFTEPFDVVGNYCPATFRVDGLKYSVMFQIGIERCEDVDESVLSTRNIFTGQVSKGRVVITSMIAFGCPVERKHLANIPTAALLDHALHATTFIGTAYPPNYRIVLDGILTFDSGSKGTVVPLTFGVRSLTTKYLRSLEGNKSPGRKMYASSWHSPEIIDAAVEFYNSYPGDFPGGRTGYVQVQLATKFGPYALSTISRMFAKAREDKKLPPVPEKYKYRNQKRGTK